MNKLLNRLMEKKGKSDMSDEYVGTKRDTLKELIGQMSDMMSEPLKGLKKVTVASDSPEGLEKGLDKAQELLGDDEMPESEEETKEESEPSEMSVEDIEAKIQELMEKKKQLEAK